MGALTAVDHTYAYGRPSQLVDDPRGKRLFLATSDAVGSPSFFKGTLVAPRRIADQLLILSDVVRSRFHVPSAMLEKILVLADPVFTCAVDVLRFEAFSSCCGVYARLDVRSSAITGERYGLGTSNVDFNAPMRAALGRIRDGDAVALSLGADSFELGVGEATLVERKVALPARWLRGFGDVQGIMAEMQPRFELDGTGFRRLLREVPQAWKGDAWLTPSANGARLGSERQAATAVRIGGVARTRLLRSIARHAVSARLFSSDRTGASAWVVTTPDSRFTLALSPEVWRGFSGEGTSLDVLASPGNGAALASTRASLRWQDVIDPSEIAARSSLEERDVLWALAECASSGIVGYDLDAGAYFYRELPFDVAASRRSQPRLRNAERLVGDARVTFDESDGDGVKAWVRVADVEYRVAIDGECARCTCTWFAKHRETRGPCKHVIAVRLAGNASVVG